MIARHFAEQSILNRLTNKKNTKDESKIVWPNLLLNCKEISFQKKVEETSLTLITNMQGPALCEIDGHLHKICSSTFLIINPFQRLVYTIDNKEETETSNIHFNYQAIQNLYNYFTKSDAFLLDNAEDINDNTLPLFLNELHYKNRTISKLIDQTLLCEENHCFDEKLAEIGVQLFLNHQEFKRRLKSVRSRKPSTKKELYQRISKAKDIIYYSYQQPLSIEELSKEVCISKYYFTRLFTDIYGISPYQFLKTVRLEKAKELLAKDYSLQEISETIGFVEINSFINAFKAYTKTYPTEFRNTISKNE